LIAKKFMLSATLTSLSDILDPCSQKSELVLLIYVNFR